MADIDTVSVINDEYISVFMRLLSLIGSDYKYYQEFFGKRKVAALISKYHIPLCMFFELVRPSAKPLLFLNRSEQ